MCLFNWIFYYLRNNYYVYDEWNLIFLCTQVKHDQLFAETTPTDLPPLLPGELVTFTGKQLLCAIMNEYTHQTHNTLITFAYK